MENDHNYVRLGDILVESKIESTNPDVTKRIRVRLNVQGVEKRPETNDVEGATKYFVRRKGQFIYGKQNLFKGAFGIVPGELDGFESSSDLPSFDVHRSCNPEWIYYYFKQDKFYETLVDLSTGTGSRRIQPKRLFEIRIPLPARKIQDEIISRFKTIEPKKNDFDNRIIDNLDMIQNLRQSILHEAVSGKLVPQDPKDEPASELLNKIKAEKEKLIKEKKIRKEKPLPPITKEEIPYELPKGWGWARFGFIFQFIDYRGKTPAKVDSGVKLITAKNIRMGYLKKEPEEFVTEKTYNEWMTRGFPQKGDLLFTTEAPMGNICEVNITEKFALAQRTINLHPYWHLSSEYLMYAIMSTSIQTLIAQQATGMTATGIKASKLKKVLVPLPPLPEQKRIVEKVDQLMKLCDELETKVKENQKNSELLMEAVLREAFEV